jgi:hypothetical protein
MKFYFHSQDSAPDIRQFVKGDVLVFEKKSEWRLGRIFYISYDDDIDVTGREYHSHLPFGRIRAVWVYVFHCPDMPIEKKIMPINIENIRYAYLESNVNHDIVIQVDYNARDEILFLRRSLFVDRSYQEFTRCLAQKLFSFDLIPRCSACAVRRNFFVVDSFFSPSCRGLFNIMRCTYRKWRVGPDGKLHLYLFGPEIACIIEDELYEHAAPFKDVTYLYHAPYRNSRYFHLFEQRIQFEFSSELEVQKNDGYPLSLRTCKAFPFRFGLRTIERFIDDKIRTSAQWLEDTIREFPNDIRDRQQFQHEFSRTHTPGCRKIPKVLRMSRSPVIEILWQMYIYGHNRRVVECEKEKIR